MWIGSVELKSKLGRDHNLIAHGSASFADKPVVHERTIHLCSIEKSNASVDSASQHCNHLLLRSSDRAMPRAGPHTAQTDGRNLKAPSSKCALFHAFSPRHCSVRFLGKSARWPRERDLRSSALDTDSTNTSRRTQRRCRPC